MTADNSNENENQYRELKVGTRINFNVQMKIQLFFSYQLSSAVNSCQYPKFGKHITFRAKLKFKLEEVNS